MKQLSKVIGGVSLSAVVCSLYCIQVVAEEPALTSAGAEASGNAAGTIPVYSGKPETVAGWTPDKPRVEFSKYKDEKPILVIDSSNVDKYADKLSAGQVALVKQTKGYSMKVYPSHRDCALPDFVQANTEKNVTAAKIATDGTSLDNAVLPGIPFPRPKTGVEAMWDFLIRYRGVGIDFGQMYTLVSPRPGTSDFLDVKENQFEYFPTGKKAGSTPKSVDGWEYAIFYQNIAPAALAGQGLVGLESFDASNDGATYYYFPGQRRVRRLPNYDYDAPQIGFENQYTIDQVTMFNGALDRFDWKIVGKKELYVPYDSFAMYDFRKGLRDVYGPQYVNADSRRYELHRVWEVVGTVKAGQRHSSPTKVFYLDEDSWNAVVGEDLDAQGKLWKVREGFSLPAWEIGGACDVESFVQYDLLNSRYVADDVSVATEHGTKWLDDTAAAKDPRTKLDFYTPDSLRSISER